MTASTPTMTGGAPSTMTPTLPLVATALTVVAATVMAANIGFLAIAHLSGGLAFGGPGHSAIVDGFYALAIVLMLPLPFALHRSLAAVDARASAAAVALAVDAIAFGAILHALFALGIVTPRDVGPLLLIGYLAFAGWIWLVASLGARDGRTPGARRMALVAISIVGLPIWLLWAARRLA